MQSCEKYSTPCEGVCVYVCVLHIYKCEYLMLISIAEKTYLVKMGKIAETFKMLGSHDLTRF